MKNPTFDTIEDYDKAIERNCQGLTAVSVGSCGDCPDCEPSGDEGEFSWRPCEICGSPLAGNRYPAHGLDANNDLVHLTCCCDCLFYFANGDLPEHLTTKG